MAGVCNRDHLGCEVQTEAQEITDDLNISPCTRRVQEDRLFFCQVTTNTSERASDFTIISPRGKKTLKNVAIAYILHWKGQQQRVRSLFVTALGSYCYKFLICVNDIFICSTI